MQTHKCEFIACNSEEQSLNWEMYSKLAITSLQLAILKEKKSHLWQKVGITQFFYSTTEKKKILILKQSQNSEM